MEEKKAAGGKNLKQDTLLAKETKKLKEALEVKYPNLWDKIDEEDKKAAYSFAESYKDFLSRAKTERVFVNVSVETLESLGYVPLSEKKTLKAGDKVYESVHGKALIAALIGSRPLKEGCNLVGAHVDAPRLDLKPHPIYEDSDLVLMKTHYYGGIKKYQWTAIPLAMHGIIYRKDGTPQTISIGESDDDPVLTITDLLPHLGKDQMSRKAPDLIKGEELNVLIGGLPYPDPDTSGRFKLGILQLLHERYGITEQDWVTAEVELVPAGPARDVGLDRSYIGAYAQDDRVCSYTALAALTSLETVEKTAIAMLFDKEEIGSDGNTGAQSRAYENFLYTILAKSQKQTDRLDFQQMVDNSNMLSADVTNGFDPTFPTVSDSRNNSYLGRGISLVKYVGSRGKSGTSDANVEFLSKVIRLFNEKEIPWQTGEMGKVDEGGGGTIAKFLAHLGMEVLDCGVPVLSMHSPFEVTSKIDVYMTFQAYRAFMDGMD